MGGSGQLRPKLTKSGNGCAAISAAFSTAFDRSKSSKKSLLEHVTFGFSTSAAIAFLSKFNFSVVHRRNYFMKYFWSCGLRTNRCCTRKSYRLFSLTNQQCLGGKNCANPGVLWWVLAFSQLVLGWELFLQRPGILQRHLLSSPSCLVL